jgi:spore coat polysaccharide biosynthesis predicted glycosyltransferase SpsG
MVMRSPRPIRALFRVAAGPRIGFGHLVRARVLSRALRIERPLVSLRGSTAARQSAERLRMRPMQSMTGGAAALLARLRPEVLVIDDPSETAARVWCRAARRAGIPVASVHDLGAAYCGADLAIDGSIVRFPSGQAGMDDRSARLLAGVRYAVLDDALRTTRPVRTAAARVLIALGGGPRRSVAWRLALALRAARPGLAIRVAGGFAEAEAGECDGVTWLAPQPGLAPELARCRVAITGGGMSLYEAVTLGTPVVAWPVVKAQAPTVEAFGRRRLAVAVMPGPGRVRRAVSAVLSALDSAKGATAAARAHGFDGRGAARVAAAISDLARRTVEVGL